MKQCKVSMLAKEHFTRFKREVREGGFHIATTIILCLSIAFFVFILGMLFINDHVKKFTVSEDFYLPQLKTFSPLSPWSAYSYFASNSSSSFLSPVKCCVKDGKLRDWTTTTQLWHSMSDKELLWRASMVPHVVDYSYNRTPKVAFMYLSRGRLPFAPLWEKFFKGHQGLYSIYLHTSPDFTNEPPKSSVFCKRRIPSKPVEWGKVTMIDAERRLLANALLDFSNERFILLSETCIPLFNFTTIYNHLINSNRSFLSSFDDPRGTGRGRYNKHMWPTITLFDWRKGSQWFEVHRKLAIEIVSDVRYYSVFQDHCRPPCYVDEHYLATFVNKICPEQTWNRSITWVDWSRGGSHPRMFVKKDVSVRFLNHMRFTSNSTCNDGESSICFLFARKFHPNTLDPLLRIAPTLLGFDP